METSLHFIPIFQRTVRADSRTDMVPNPQSYLETHRVHRASILIIRILNKRDTEGDAHSMLVPSKVLSTHALDSMAMQAVSKTLLTLDHGMVFGQSNQN